MSTSDLFDRPEANGNWHPVSGTQTPLIYLRKLWLLDSLKPGTKPMREVEFRPGINVVWADPRTVEARAGGTRVAGHSAGKTTLCRIIRWLLGEGYFAPLELEAKIATELKDGWAVLALELNGHPWLTGRPFFYKSQHSAAAGLSLDELLEHGWPENAENGAFIAELERMTIRSFKQIRFPGRETDIAWTQILGWLARDQETALVDVAAWRSSAKTPGERGPTVDERHLLLRLALGILGDAEMRELEKCDAWKKDRRIQSDSRPALFDRLEQACLRLAPLVQRDGEPLKGELLLGPARKAVEERDAALTRMKEALKSDDLFPAEAIYRQAHAALAEARRDLRAAQRFLNEKKERFEMAASALLEAQKQIIHVAQNPAPGYCAASPEEAAAAQCTAFRPQPADFDLAALVAKFSQDRDQSLEEWKKAQNEVKECEAALPVLEQNDEALAGRATAARQQREEQLAAAGKLSGELENQRSLVEAAEAAHTALINCDTSIKSIGEDISASRGLQRSLRQETHFSDRLAFNAQYENVLRFLLGPETGGKVDFGEDGDLVLNAWSRAPMSSGAIDALKVIAFDLAALLWKVIGRGNHPRLLIHDSPKVADMSPALYGPLFDLAVQAEEDAGGIATFQYILTTTEPPPLELQGTERVILTLDASKPEGRLFGRDFNV